jgi:AbrB family looped-hinge helix DNA binding protein
MRSTISSKGGITVPAEVRKKLGLTPGTPIEFELRSGEVVLRRRVKSAHPVDQAFGLLSLRKPMDRLHDEMRGGPSSKPTSSGKKQLMKGV